MYVTALKSQGGAIECIDDKFITEEFCILAVQYCDHALNLISKKNQTEKVYMAAVTEYGDSLEYVKKQTLEICIEAVKQDEDAFEYVEAKFKKPVSKFLETYVRNNKPITYRQCKDIYIY